MTEASPRGDAPLTLAVLEGWLARMGASLHLRVSGDRFFVVAHVAAHTIAADASSADLDQAITIAMSDVDAKLAELNPAPKLRKRSELRR